MEYINLHISTTHFSHAIKWRDPLAESNVYILGEEKVKCREEKENKGVQQRVSEKATEPFLAQCGKRTLHHVCVTHCPTLRYARRSMREETT